MTLQSITMFTPRLSKAIRAISNRGTQCLRQQRLEEVRQNPRSYQMQQLRHQHQSSTKKRSAFMTLWKAHPFSVTTAMICIGIGGGFLMYTNYYYHNYIIGAFHKFPEPVAKQMRKAIYYTNISLEPKNAVKYYREALRVADEIGMDPFSDEIIGVKIQLAALMEKVHHYQKAIDILEIVKSDNLKWMAALGDKQGNEGKRTRVLLTTVRVSVKLGDLYSNQYVLEREKAEECLVWAVDTVIREHQRREKEGVKEGEGQWASPEEQGGALEALAHHYEEKNIHYLAAPLFLQALTVSPPKSCHTIVLMNNLSISLAQQLPPPTPGRPTASRSEYVQNARAWAQKAIEIAAHISPPERTEECDLGCAVATHNLAEFAEMDGNIAEARKKYTEARSLAKAIGFTEGMQNSETALRRLGTP